VRKLQQISRQACNDKSTKKIEKNCLDKKIFFNFATLFMEKRLKKNENIV
jgi:hypothetical protein